MAHPNDTKGINFILAKITSLVELIVWNTLTGPGWVIASRIPGGPLHFWAGRGFFFFFFTCHVSYIRLHTFRILTPQRAASAWVVPCEVVLPSPERFAGRPYRNGTRQGGWMGGRGQEGLKKPG